jgi:hypothetical protein
VRPQLAQRELGLAAIAFLGAVIVLSISVTHSSARPSSPLPPPADWNTALAAPYTPARRTACGQRVRRTTLGVAHPVLPCGVVIYLQFEGKRVLTQVIDKAPAVPGREFDLTRALASRIGLHGVQQVRWAFAR